MQFPFDDISSFVCEFENGTLPKEQWTHEAHLAVGAFYVCIEGKETALEKIRVQIQKYNVATGGANTDTSGYHETLTVFWIWAIDSFLKTLPVEFPVELKVRQLLQSPQASKDYPFIFYSREYLLSTAARKSFAEPDLKKLQ